MRLEVFRQCWVRIDGKDFLLNGNRLLKLPGFGIGCSQGVQDIRVLSLGCRYCGFGKSDGGGPVPNFGSLARCQKSGEDRASPDISHICGLAILRDFLTTPLGGFRKSRSIARPQMWEI